MGDASPKERRGTRGNPDNTSLSDLVKHANPRLAKELVSTFTQQYIEKTASPQRATFEESPRPSSSRAQNRPRSQSRLSVSTPALTPKPQQRAQSNGREKAEEEEEVIPQPRIRQPSTANSTTTPVSAGARRKAGGGAAGGAANKARSKSSSTAAAPSSSKRVKGKRITRQILIGSEAWKLPETGDPARPSGVPADHTKGWRIYVRNVHEGPDMTTWLSKVQFKIYHTYPNPNRTVEAQPFEISETGWGGFNVDIRLYFQPIAHEKPVYRQHFLQLDPYGNEEQQAKQSKDNLIRSEICEFVEFSEPTEALFEALTSDAQFEYLLPDNKSKRGPGSGAKKGMGSLGLGRNVDLPEHGTDANPYSKDMERQQVKIFQDAETLVEKFMADERKKSEEMAKQLLAIKEQEAALKKELDEVQASQNGASGANGTAAAAVAE